MSNKIFYYSTGNNTDNFYEGNFGDILSAYIYEKLSKNTSLQYFNPDQQTFVNNYKDQHYFICGSIFNFANDTSIIWGSGIIEENTACNTRVIENIKCVRGPRTNNFVNIKFDTSLKLPMGDPALLLRYLYKPKKNRRYKLGIIPHLNDYNAISKMQKSDDIVIINLYCNKHTIENVIDIMYNCDYLISSSLHGIIVAQAYIIPCYWFILSEIPGDNINFYDYFESVYSDNYTPKLNITINLTKVNDIINEFKNYKYPDLITNRCFDLIKSCPFNKISFNIINRNIYHIIDVGFKYKIDWLVMSLYNSKYGINIRNIFYDKNNVTDLKQYINNNDIYIIHTLFGSDMCNHFIELKNSKLIKYLGITISGNPSFYPSNKINIFDVIYYETLWGYRNSYLNQHHNVIRAFGVGVDIYKNIKLEKKYDYIFVGSINDSLKKFSKISLLPEKSSVLLVGDINSNNDNIILEQLRKKYNITVKQRCDLQTLITYYSESKNIFLPQPTYGGGERALLEAKYMGLDIIIVDNNKLTELNKENIIFDLNYYTKQLELGIDNVIKNIDK